MPNLRLSRRQLLAALAAATAAAPKRAVASSVADRRFIFVYTMGGWDITRVFASLLGSPEVSTEVDAAEATVGGIPFIDHPDRPSVRAFLEKWHGQTCFVNGVYCPSISHSGALKTTWTARPDGATADWPTRIAAAQADRYIIPYLVVGGPYFAGDDGVYVCRAGSADQLSGLVTGSALQTADHETEPPSLTSMQAIDDWLLGEGETRGADGNENRARAAQIWTEAQRRSSDLKAFAQTLDLSSGEEFAEQLDLGVRALSSGLSRVVSLTHPKQNSLTAWDSHAINDPTQSYFFETLFASLDELLDKLATTAAPEGGMLSDITTVIVMSEMGRTPYMNASGGKDHWPYTSAMYIGPAITGDRVIGAFDDDQYGLAVNLDSGETEESGELLGVDVMGATMLRLADIDPAEQGIESSALETLLV